MPDSVESGTVFHPLKESSFQFGCHRGIECFTKCCADLKLVLTPYDILRMKRRLELRSDVFLDRYTDTRLEPDFRFPRVILKMRDDDRRTCPFVTTDGCSIYEDRPGACRIYPLGRASMVLEDGKGKVSKEKFFIVREKHCLGFSEGRRWTPEEWMENEGLGEYNRLNDQWQEILTSSKNLGNADEIPRKIQMFFMASYNLDRFREFIFRSRFLSLFEVNPSEREDIASDDTALLHFAFRWLKFSLYGEGTIKMKA
ncbi:MAG: YkgJ family cysteine cluster protein [Deltaproteobacteria bacterium]|nr:YkgJ family cysteine cluster protein [Deltaproteobacteria bacterium]MBW2017299.1 YkgJ family cysteine cluster protein [Deltaproteobacteria bacterium]MBW2129399.1 YkgJ family cysteine cluster protein [Deltaproteobacteria bacterium]MBW2303571.1 YkgJ family cysteine cluster protein [Deltaproteobacteria bacterium]